MSEEFLCTQLDEQAGAMYNTTRLNIVELWPMIT